MASPKALIQILVTGTRIVGKAFLEGGRQAVKNAKSSPAAVESDVAGVSHASSKSPSDQLTRQHRMTLDEAHLILNLKRGADSEALTTQYEHLFKANSPPAKAPAAGKPPTLPMNSHYLLSKVVRARERIVAEQNISTTSQPQPGPGPLDGPPSSNTPPIM
ncbi:hypothetical protein DL96DRAFT_1602596, partial [Flagelloscypha sp. PMI_526]